VGAIARLQCGSGRHHRSGVGRAARAAGRRGIKTARISGSGIFKDAASDETLRQYFFNGTVRAWRLIVPELGTVEACSTSPRSNMAASMTAW
jgi:predicted secreted protein